MKRQEKYPNTDTFTYFNANPHNRKGGDCVVRAIATTLEQSWETTVQELTLIGIKYGYVLNDKSCYEKYLASKGWIKHPQPRKYDNTKYTGKEFCKKRLVADRCIAHIGGHHLVAIVDSKVLDIWDSTEGCIGNYWTKG